MHGSSVQVVGVEVINAFTACRCLLSVANIGGNNVTAGVTNGHPNVNLGMPFHDLCDASSQALQLSNE